ncbi:MAG: secretin N-terminal domain-containing protein [Planctomycetota bacterium]
MLSNTPRRRWNGIRMLSAAAMVALAGSAIGQTDQPADDPTLDEPVEITQFAEPIDINDFVDLVATVLEINVIKDSTLSGQVAFNTGVNVTKRQLLPLLDARLEELGFTIVPDTTGFYTIRRAETIASIPGETTRFIATPGMRPSALRPTIETHLNIAGGGRVSYDDELGSIVVTASPRQIQQLAALVEAYSTERDRMVIETIPLKYISSQFALQRATDLLGARSSAAPLPAAVRQQNEATGAGGGSAGTGLTSLAQRLTPDPAGNALLFRGPAEELGAVRAIIERVDRPNELVGEKYRTGSATRRIADLASSRGLGQIVEAAEGLDLSGQGVNPVQQQFNQQFAGGSAEQAIGSQMLVDQAEGFITYFATPEQQLVFAELLEGFDVEDEVVVTVPYKLEYSDAADVASILESLISRSRPQEDTNAFLPRGQQTANQTTPQQQLQPGTTLSDSETAINSGEGFVIADEANNQVLVQAPRSQQSNFERLIRQIDLRRAQVYIEATIISVSDTDDFRLAIEGAFNDIDGSGNGGGLQSNFGLSAPGASFVDPRMIATGLSGLTAAVIRSDFVPFIITATQTDSSSRVIATPQLLVDDNAAANVLTRQTVPFEVVNTTDIAQTITFEEAEAETSLDVTPQISVGGTVRLEYTIVQQTFTSLPGDGSPPPTVENEIGGLVSVPNGGTVVIGGLPIENDSESIIKIPLLGDIPVLGNLFRDTSRDSSSTVLFVFLTPRVLRDPELADYRLLTEGPAAAVELADYIPEFEPVMIRALGPAEAPTDSTAPALVLPSDRDPTLDQRGLRPSDTDG